MIGKLTEGIEFIRRQTTMEPEVGIILGTGLGALVDMVDIETRISYEDIPYFPVATVEHHNGFLIFGQLEGRKVVVMQGRFHYYEGYTMQEVTFPVRIMKMLGIKQLFISNAAGGLNPDFAVSDLMVIQDHINLLPDNPLRGKNIDELGGRFPDMSDPYDLDLVKKAVFAGKDLGLPVHQGVYASVQGPNLETPAEYKYLRIIGADAVGMSTVPENIVARHMGLPVFALSVITDMCTPDTIKPVHVPEIIAAAAKAEPYMTKLIKAMLRR